MLTACGCGLKPWKGADWFERENVFRVNQPRCAKRFGREKVSKASFLSNEVNCGFYFGFLKFDEF